MKDRKRNKENYEKRIIQDVNKVTTQVQHVESKIKHVESIQSKVKERKLNESKVKEVYKNRFNELWNKYPNKDGKTQAQKHFNTSVKTEKDWQDINTALKNYLISERVKNGYIKNGSTWFNNWRDWIDYVELKPAIQQKGEQYGKIKRHSAKYSDGEVI